MPVPVDLEPPELARLADYAERPRADDWSLRSALVRYAQPEPERVNLLLELVRRIEWALKPHRRIVEREGPALWDALHQNAAQLPEPQSRVVGLLGTMGELDRLGDVLAAWAGHRTGERPNAEVDAVTADVARRLDALGVPREERVRPPRQRG
jgi:hypothetical protein